MAGKSEERKVSSAVSQKQPSVSKTELSKKASSKSSAAPPKNVTEDFLAKEEEYKDLNAKLEAKTADLVREADEIMKGHNELLLDAPLSVPLSDLEDDVYPGMTFQTSVVQDLSKATKKEVTSNIKRAPSGKQGKKLHSKTKSAKSSCADDDAAAEEMDDFLAKTIQNMEERMNNSDTHEDFMNDGPKVEDIIVSGVSDVQIRVFKAKLRIMQEELDQLSSEYYKKDDENAKLTAKIKDLEDDRVRYQKTTNIHLTQIEKHKALAEELNKKCDGLLQQISALHKEIENLNKSAKQAAVAHNTVEVRLNRALEEVEKLKNELTQARQTNRDKMSEEQRGRDNLLAENKTLAKQKAELILGFKKQLKLIDILKRQKMHMEAAKLLSFTEDEFMKALDWGNS